MFREGAMVEVTMREAGTGPNALEPRALRTAWGVGSGAGEDDGPTLSADPARYAGRLRAAALLIAAVREVCGAGVSPGALGDLRLIVCDPVGVVLWATGGEALPQGAVAWLSAGADLGEAAVGANAVAAAVATGREQLVVGAGHTNPCLRDVSCAACPVSPAEREVVGLVVLVGPVEGVAVADTPPERLLGLARMVAGAVATLLARNRLRRLYDEQRAVASAVALHIGSGRLIIGADGAPLSVSPDVRSVLYALRGREREDATESATAREGAPAMGASGRGSPAPTAGAEAFGLLVAGLEAGERSFQYYGRPFTGFPLRGAGGELEAAVLLLQDRDGGGGPAPDTDPVMSALERLVDGLGASHQPVLVVGEAGSGRRRLAQRLCAAGGVSAPVVLDCSQIAWRALDRLLFGHARRGGGCLRASDGGAVILLEIGEMPAPVQLRLYRFLTDPRRGGVGPGAPRVVATGRSDLADRARAGSFRADLFALLAARGLSVPPLRARVDLQRLVTELCAELRAGDGGAGGAQAIDPAVFVSLGARPWHGNVRELRSALAEALAAAGSGALCVSHLPRPTGAGAGPLVRANTDLESLTERAMRDALAAAAGNVSVATKALGVSRSTMYRMMARYGLR